MHRNPTYDQRRSALMAALLAAAILVVGCAQQDAPRGPVASATVAEPSLSATVSPSAAPSARSPAVAISPSSGPAGTELEVVAVGFPPEAEAEIGVGRRDSEYDVVGTIRADAQGAVHTSVTLPGPAAPSEVWIVIVTTADGSIGAASNPFQVTAETFEPTVQISPTSGPPGTAIEVDAQGFPGFVQVEVGLGRENSEYDVVETAQTAAEGGLAIQVQVPDYAEAPERWVVVVSTQDHAIRVVSNAFQVVERQQTPAVRVSPREGSVGTSVRLEAEGFAANETVDIGLGRVNSEYDVIATAQTDVRGAVDTQVRVPEFVEPRDRWVFVVATRDRSVQVISEEFNVTLAPTPTPASDNLFTRTDIYLIAVGDDGASGMEVGCDDSVVPVEVEIEPTIAPLTAALEAILAIRTREYGQSGLYNALYRSDLTLDEVTIDGREAVMRLSGSLSLGGVCDGPRARAQLQQTALQYGTVDSTSIFVNGVPLDDVLSLR